MSDDLGELIQTYSPFQIFKDAMVREAFTNGKWAAIEGKTPKDCPHRGGHKRKAWITGHHLQSIGMKAAAELARIVAEHPTHRDR